MMLRCLLIIRRHFFILLQYSHSVYLLIEINTINSAPPFFIRAMDSEGICRMIFWNTFFKFDKLLLENAFIYTLTLFKEETK